MQIAVCTFFDRRNFGVRRPSTYVYFLMSRRLVYMPSLPFKYIFSVPTVVRTTRDLGLLQGQTACELLLATAEGGGLACSEVGSRGWTERPLRRRARECWRENK